MGIARVVRFVVVAPVFVAATAVSGCGNDERRESIEGDPPATSTTSSGPNKASSGSETGSEEAQSAADPRARKALRTAFLRLADANTGRFELSLQLGSEYGIHERGRYQVRPVAYDVIREMRSPEGVIHVAYRGVGDDLWMRLEAPTDGGAGVQAWPCWVNYADMTSLGQLPAEWAQAPDGQPPAALVTASYGIGHRTIDVRSIEGTTDLALALGLVSGKFVVASGIDVKGDDTVPATFTLDEGTLSGFKVALSDLPDAIESAGGDLPAGLDDLATAPGAITTRFTDVGLPVNIEVPPANERLTFTGPADFESAMRSCGEN